MSLLRQLLRGTRSLTQPSAAEKDVADEVQHYLEQTTAAHVARGLSRTEALRAARLELGGVDQVKEQVRGYGWENVVATAITDLRYGARRLRAAPGFTTVTLLTLALGIGGTTAIFSAVNPILFEPLPYPHADRIVMVWELWDDGRHGDSSFGMYRGVLERARSFDALAMLKTWQPTMTGPEQPERFEGQRVSASYFRVLGVTPALGRSFVASDDVLHGPNVVLLSDRLWRRRFGGDSTIVGRPITLNDNAYTVIGVMPHAFDNVLAPHAELWAPLQYDMSQGRAWGHHLQMVGRLRAGVSEAQATREMDVVGQTVLDDQHPDTYGPDVEFSVVPLQDEVTRAVKPALLAILGAMSLVLVIACVNVTNLLLARGVHRQGEFALRAALGAGQGRLLRQLLTESLLLAVVGGAIGMAVAIVGVRALIALSPPGLPRAAAIGVDGRAFVFGMVVTTVIGVAFGLIPALRASRTDPHDHLQRGSRRTSGSHLRTRSVLVVAEVALALVLLAASGLLLRSLQRLLSVPPGFSSAELLTMQVQTSGRRYASDSTTYRFFAEALEAVQHVPGVRAAALTSQLPLSGDAEVFGVHFESSPSQRPDDDRSAYRYAVSPGYIETMRIPLKRGRALTEQDRAGAPLVVLISESLAKRRFPGLDPIGQRLRIGPMDSQPFTVVGVVGDVKQLSLTVTQPDAVYTTASQWRFAANAMSLVVRAHTDAASLAPAIRAAVWSVDKDQPVVRVATMDELLAHSAAELRFALAMFEAFALAALVLAAAGIYGVLAGSVAERTREIGVRSALGASRQTIIAMVVRQGMTLTGAGVVLGLVGAAGASQALVAMLFGVSRLDPVTYVGVIVLLGAVAAVACSVPAWRAARVDPVRALRAE